jgi:hypothetical protein
MDTETAVRIAKTIAELRVHRDAAAVRGDHGKALVLNDRINDLKNHRSYLMGSTWESLLKALVDGRDADYLSDAGRDQARRDNLEYIVQTMLEKLRDEEREHRPWNVNEG